MSVYHILLEILDERLRQTTKLSHSPERDNMFTAKELAVGAAHLALTHTYAFVRDGFDKTPAVNWPWGPPQGQGSSHRTNCIRAMAMLCAEVERLDCLTVSEAQAATADYIAHATGTHGSPELDEDAAKLRALGQDPGPTAAEMSEADAASAPQWLPIEEAPEHVKDAARVCRETKGALTRLFHGPSLTLYAIHLGERWVRLPDETLP